MDKSDITAKEPAHMPKPTILIIEDDPLIRTELQIFLRGSGRSCAVSVWTT